MALRDEWKQVGVGLGHAFRDLAKTVVKTASEGAKKVEDWAEDKHEGTIEVEAEPESSESADPSENKK